MRRATVALSTALLGAAGLLVSAPAALAAPVAFTCTGVDGTTVDITSTAAGGDVAVGATVPLGALTTVFSAPGDVSVFPAGTVWTATLTLHVVRPDGTTADLSVPLSGGVPQAGDPTSSVTWSGGAASTVADLAGSYTVTGTAFSVSASNPDTEQSLATDCTADTPPTVVTFTAAAPVPPTTPAAPTTAAAAPVRPTVVRTDASQPQPAELPVWLVGAGLVGLVGAAGATRVVATSRSRKH